MDTVHQICAAVYLAIVQGGRKLIGSQGKLRPLVEVHPAAHVVQVLEEGDRHCGGTSSADEDATVQFH